MDVFFSGRNVCKILTTVAVGISRDDNARFGLLRHSSGHLGENLMLKCQKHSQGQAVQRNY